MQQVELRELRFGDVFEEVDYGVAHYQVLTNPQVSKEADGLELFAWDLETGAVTCFFESIPGFLDLVKLDETDG